MAQRNRPRRAGGDVIGLERGSGAFFAGDAGDGLAGGAAFALGGLLVELLALDVLGQAFLFAELLETPHHLLDALAATGLDPNRHHRSLPAVGAGFRAVLPLGP